MKTKLNDKGLTAIEILLCFVLVSIIVISMMSVVTNYKNREEIESTKNNIITYKNTITKAIYDDIIKNKGITKATITETGNNSNDYELEKQITLTYKNSTSSVIKIHAYSKCYNVERKNGKSEKTYNQACNEENSSNIDENNSEYYIDFKKAKDSAPERFSLTKIGGLKFNDISVEDRTSTDGTLTNATNFISIHIGLIQTDLGTKYDILNIVTPNVDIYKGALG